MEKIGMLTTDIALKADPIYHEIVRKFANEENKFITSMQKGL